MWGGGGGERGGGGGGGGVGGGGGGRGGGGVGSASPTRILVQTVSFFWRFDGFTHRPRRYNRALEALEGAGAGAEARKKQQHPQPDASESPARFALIILSSRRNCKLFRRSPQPQQRRRGGDQSLHNGEHFTSAAVVRTGHDCALKGYIIFPLSSKPLKNNGRLSAKNVLSEVVITLDQMYYQKL